MHGGEAVLVDGILAWHTGVPVRYWNGAHVTAVPSYLEAALQRVERWFAERRLPYGVLVPAELEPAVAPSAGATGLSLAAVQRVMVLEADDFHPGRANRQSLLRSAQELDRPLLALDDVKEALADILGLGYEEWSNRVGDAAAEVIFRLARSIPTATAVAQPPPTPSQRA